MALIPFLVDVFQDPIFSLITVIDAFGIGIFQGWILGRAILLRFPRLQNHVKTVSISLFILFLANAILSVPRFASPEKIDLANISAGSSGGFVSLLFLIFGMNTGFLTVLAISVIVMTFVLLKFTQIHGVAKAFVFFFSALLLVFTAMNRFTNLTPSTFEVLLYFLYQLGIIMVFFLEPLGNSNLKNWNSNNFKGLNQINRDALMTSNSNRSGDKLTVLALDCQPH